jgi:hypothetical protein
MKFLVAIASFIAAAAAQSVSIVQPAAGGTVRRGTPTNVIVARPVRISAELDFDYVDSPNT